MVESVPSEATGQVVVEGGRDVPGLVAHLRREGIEGGRELHRPERLLIQDGKAGALREADIGQGPGLVQRENQEQLPAHAVVQRLLGIDPDPLDAPFDPRQVVDEAILPAVQVDRLPGRFARVSREAGAEAGDLISQRGPRPAAGGPGPLPRRRGRGRASCPRGGARGPPLAGRSPFIAGRGGVARAGPPRLRPLCPGGTRAVAARGASGILSVRGAATRGGGAGGSSRGSPLAARRSALGARLAARGSRLVPGMRPVAGGATTGGAAGGARMRTRSGVSEKTGGLEATRKSSPTSPACSRSESVTDRLRIDCGITTGDLAWETAPPRHHAPRHPANYKQPSSEGQADLPPAHMPASWFLALASRDRFW